MSKFSTEQRLTDQTDYGALAHNLDDCGTEPYYLTTAISYTNGLPHIGHAYEFATSDIIVRFRRALGYDTHFVTGTDEHGQKVAASAEKAGLQPLEHCDVYVDAFKALHRKLLISYSRFVRTTDRYHELTSQKLWGLCAAAGDIYLDAYEGWYNEREETFVSDADAEAAQFKDPGSGVELKRVKEESYFFRMSKYTDRLIKFIEEKPSFIEPEQYRNNILGRLRKDGLRDLSISRTSFEWGIPVPEGFDQRHVMYVWFDALVNYMSAVDALSVGRDVSDANVGSCAELPPIRENGLSQYWPAATHVIGKDIVWFHCVIWPCMLMSANIPLPGGVFSHGFVNAADGRKMSKSYNNTIDPIEIIEKYPIDSLRYYLASSATYGSDLNFSEDALIAMHNSELADTLGNLIHRVLNLCHKYCGGVVPESTHDEQFSCPFDMAALKSGVNEDLKICAIHTATARTMEAVRATNRFLTEAEPWKMKGDEVARRVPIVRTTLEAVYAFSHFLAAVMPLAAQAIFEKLGTAPRNTENLRDDFYNLKPGTGVTVGSILFQKIDAESSNSAAAGAGDTIGTAAAVKGSKGRKEKAVPVASSAVSEEMHTNDFTKMELRVGRITKVWPHPTADRLFCEEIDLGADAGGVRQVASGLREHYTEEQLQDRLVVVVCNLKESKFQGFMSCGMVLAAKGGAAIELVQVKDSSKVGERVFVRGLNSEEEGPIPPPLAPNRVKKLKVWEAVMPDLCVDANGLASWQNRPLLTSAGPCTVASLTEVPLL